MPNPFEFSDHPGRHGRFWTTTSDSAVSVPQLAVRIKRHDYLRPARTASAIPRPPEEAVYPAKAWKGTFSAKGF
jgi:hypothetical protein